MSFDLLRLTMTALAGGGVGFLSGVFGVGGGFLLVPVLTILLGIPVELAVGAGACQVLGPATTSLLARRIGWQHLKLPLIVAGGLFVGVFVGAGVLEDTKSAAQIVLPGGPVPMSEFVVLVTYLVLLLAVGLFAMWEARRFRQSKPIKRGWIAGWRLQPLAILPEAEGCVLSIPILAWFGLGVGFLSGLLGMSGGLILLPGLIYLLGLRTHQAVVGSMVIVWIVAAQATVIHAWHDNIDLTLVAALLFGGTAGARLGAEFGERLGACQLRQRFGWMALGAAALIAFRVGRMFLAG